MEKDTSIWWKNKTNLNDTKSGWSDGIGEITTY